MRSHDPRNRPSRRQPRPGIERLEARELLSIASTASPRSVQGIRPEAALIQALARRQATHGHVEPAATQSNRVPPFFNPALIPQFADQLYGPDSSTPMQPTPRELHRETLTARFVGNYTLGPPRFSDRLSAIHAIGKTGGSNAFLKGRFQFALYPPLDPNAAPNPGDPYANQVVGVAGLFPSNFLQTGSILILDLNGQPAPASDPTALPTRLTWTYDTNSGGAFTAPLGFTQGTGVADIQYLPDHHPLPGTLGSGRVIISFQGLLNYNELISAVSKVYS